MKRGYVLYSLMIGIVSTCRIEFDNESHSFVDV